MGFFLPGEAARLLHGGGGNCGTITAHQIALCNTHTYESVHRI